MEKLRTVETTGLDVARRRVRPVDSMLLCRPSILYMIRLGGHSRVGGLGVKMLSDIRCLMMKILDAIAQNRDLAEEP